MSIQITTTQNLIVVDQQPIRGPDGQPLAVAKYVHQNITTNSSGTLSIDVSTASSFLVNLNHNVTQIDVTGWPDPSYSQFVSVYFKQGGSFSVMGWDSNFRWGDAIPPSFADLFQDQIGHVMLNSFDQGNTVFSVIIADSYS